MKSTTRHRQCQHNNNHTVIETQQLRKPVSLQKYSFYHVSLMNDNGLLVATPWSIQVWSNKTWALASPSPSLVADKLFLTGSSLVTYAIDEHDVLYVVQGIQYVFVGRKEETRNSCRFVCERYDNQLHNVRKICDFEQDRRVRHGVKYIDTSKTQVTMLKFNSTKHSEVVIYSVDGYHLQTASLRSQGCEEPDGVWDLNHNMVLIRSNSAHTTRFAKYQIGCSVELVQWVIDRIKFYDVCVDANSSTIYGLTNGVNKGSPFRIILIDSNSKCCHSRITIIL